MSERNPEALKQIIIQSWSEGKSATIIARELSVTRSAVLGLIHRMREAGIELARRQKTPPKPRQSQGKKIIVKKPEPVLVFDKVDPVPDRKTGIKILDLRRDSCRYVTSVGENNEDGLAQYCGKMAVKRRYCAEHAKLCYEPLKEVKPRKKTRSFQERKLRVRFAH